MDDVVYVNDVIKGETVSYPQGVRNFGDNYIDVIIYFSMVFYRVIRSVELCCCDNSS